MRMIIGAAIAIIGMVGMIAVVAPAIDAPAGSSSGCTATSGVTVIVDFTHFPGGDIERGCAPGQPTSALNALHAAGFTTAGTTQYGDAFLCRIDGLPQPSQEACTVTPSPTAYWAFWHARPADANWTYATVGVLDYRPAPGSIEAFAFGSHALPGISPSAALPPPPPTTRATAPPTTAPPTTAPPPVVTQVPPPATAAPTVSAATLPTGSAPTTTKGPVGTVVPAPPSSSISSSSSGVTSSAPKRTTTSEPTRVVERSAAGRAPHDGSGSPLAAVVTIVVVGALAIGATAFTRARRHRPA